ncbi:MAG TPA: alpha/beta hydrolase-fold protein [Chthoniobacterales bacterium]
MIAIAARLPRIEFPRHMFPRLLLLVVFLASTAFARSPHKEPITFSYTGDVGFGNSVFLVGNHPDLGNWDVTHAIKLHFTSGNVWTAQVAIQSGTQLQYRFISRANSNSRWCDSSNVSWLTAGNLSLTVPSQPEAPYRGKTIYYLSGWSTAQLFYNNNGTFVSAAMTKVGAGRVANESLFKITGIGEAGEPLEFVFADGNGNYDNPAGGGNYYTDLDVFEVQDGNVFSYQPPSTVSPPTIVTQFVNSTAANIPSRNVHVYLPRGYAQNGARRYPVLYLHDGQNVFDPGGQFGSWSADATATQEIGQGRVREMIMVAIDNTDQRIPEYMPPTDTSQGTQGRGDAYASFVINNVRPYVDFNYRTLNDAKNTVLAGSSLGGLISLYFGREFTTFGKIGVLSPAYWIAPNYVAQVASGTKKPLRVYEDFGTAETASDWDNAQSMYDVHLAQGYVANADLTFVAGCGQQHNEAAWKVRFPGMLHYLLPVREEPNELAQREYPPAFEINSLNVPNESASFQYSALFGFTYTLERSLDLLQWTPVSASSSETLPWNNETISDSGFPSSAKMFWRLKATPAR